MLPKVTKAYREFGMKIDLGNPGRLYSTLIDLDAKRTINTSGGFTISDAFFFMQLQRSYEAKAIFIVGNSFGLSTFVLSEIYPIALVDAIDAEVEGLEARRGTELTRQIAARYFPNVQVTVGFSPQNIDLARRSAQYDLMFIDGYHSNEQMLLDFNGLLPYCADKCVIVFHDVGYAKMLAAWQTVQDLGKPLGFEGFTLGYTQFGTCVLARGDKDTTGFLSSIASDFNGPYKIGFVDEDSSSYSRRPFFWDLSFGYLERLIRRKIQRLMKR